MKTGWRKPCGKCGNPIERTAIGHRCSQCGMEWTDPTGMNNDNSKDTTDDVPLVREGTDE
jgi:hypothetical protein